MEPSCEFTVGRAQKVQGAARRRNIFPEQLRLGPGKSR